MKVVILGIFILLSIALIGWMLAEVKAKFCQYESTDDEVEAEKETNARLLKCGWKEMSIKDFIKLISTKGFSAN